MAPIRYPRLQDVEWLRREYIGRMRSTTDIALEVGCKSATVSFALKRHGIPVRPRNAPHGLGYRRRLRVKRDVTCRVARDRQEELQHAAELPARLTALMAAHRVNDPVALRGALVDVAALCEGWARLIPQKQGAVQPVLRERRGTRQVDPYAPVMSRQVKPPAGRCRCSRPLIADDGLCAKCGR